MVELRKKPLISYQINALKGAGVSEIAIVTGYKSEMLENFSRHIFYNSKWHKTNMVFSLFCAKSWFNQSIIVSYSDIVYPKEFVEKLIRSDKENVLIIDENWKKLWRMRFENPLSDAETLIINIDKSIKEIGKKTDNYKNIEGQYIGLFKLSSSMLCKIFSNDKLNIKTLDFTSLFQNLILSGEKILLKKLEINGLKLIQKKIYLLQKRI